MVMYGVCTPSITYCAASCWPSPGTAGTSCWWEKCIVCFFLYNSDSTLNRSAFLLRDWLHMWCLRDLSNSVCDNPVFCFFFLSAFLVDQDVRYTAVSSFIFLRFFAPAILSPNLFHLRPHHPVSLIFKTNKHATNIYVFMHISLKISTAENMLHKMWTFRVCLVVLKLFMFRFPLEGLLVPVGVKAEVQSSFLTLRTLGMGRCMFFYHR